MMVLFNSEPMIAGKTHSEILAMRNWTRKRWYKKIPPEEKEMAMKIVESARRTKISAAATERWKDPEFRDTMIGENNPFFGKTHSEKTRAMMGEAKTGENHPMYGKTRPQFSEIMKGENNPMKRPDVIVKRSGENHHNWQGGISTLPYGPEFNSSLKNQIRERDNHTCQECHQTEDQLEYPLSVHHIDYDKKNNGPENLISLCRSCHSQTNFSREDWTEYFGTRVPSLSRDREEKIMELLL